MGGDRLKFGGEFRDAAMEHAFTAARLDETLRQCRLLFLLSARAAGAQAPAIVLVPLLLNALLAMALPFGFAGWGLREGAAALSWSIAGLDAAQGVAASISYGVLTLIGSLPGLLALLRLRAATR